MDASSDRSADIVVTVDGDCATVSLTRPHVRNAQTPEMWNQMAEIGRSMSDESLTDARSMSVRCLIDV